MKVCSALIIEDEENVQSLLQRILRKHCSGVDVAADGEEALAKLRAGSYDLVILDLMLPKVSGLAVAEAMESLPRRPRLIVHSAISRYFADRFPADTVVLQKPYDIDRIEEVLREMGLA